MVLWIGVDDTDSRGGMCTTFLATELIRELTAGYDLIGFPRLVRLNPNVPWKTRGNGAICFRLGLGCGNPFVIGELGGRAAFAYPRGQSIDSPEEVAAKVGEIVERWSRFDDPTTHPAFVVLWERPDARLYWRAVREFVEIPDAIRMVRGRGIIRMYKEGRGIVGAAAAVAWRPRDRTYEVLAYRDPSRWGTRRFVDAPTVQEMDRLFPSTFNNYDYQNHRVVIAPRSPCPVLLGIRGDIADDLPRALRRVRSEAIDRTLIFETNQGTDDHVVGSGPVRPGITVRLPGTVKAFPRTMPGGHVVLQLANFQATVYEPAKQFRDIARALAPGDRVSIVGSVRDSPRTVNIEKIRVDSLVTLRRKVRNPTCVKCGKRMKSSGRDATFRCIRCRTVASRRSATYQIVPRFLHRGWYEPPVGARRHLSRPLKRSGGRWRS